MGGKISQELVSAELNSDCVAKSCDGVRRTVPGCKPNSLKTVHASKLLSLFHPTCIFFSFHRFIILLPMSSSPPPNNQQAFASPGSLPSLQQAQPSAADEIESLLHGGENDETSSEGSPFSISPSQVDSWGSPAIVGRPPGYGPVRSNELALVRILCNKHSFSPYQREELEALVEHVCPCLSEFAAAYQLFKAENPLLRDIRIYAKQCVIEKRIEEIISSAASYVVSSALMVRLISPHIGNCLLIIMASKTLEVLQLQSFFPQS